MALTFFQVDAFTSEAFHGNPAAVVFVHDQALSSEQMQNIAAENNLSETAYLEHEDQGQIADLAYFSSASSFRLRWFTPATEVALCGHATLASAAAIFQGKAQTLAAGTTNPNTKLSFQTASGTLTVQHSTADGTGALSMDLPSFPSDPEQVPVDWQSADSKLMQIEGGHGQEKYFSKPGSAAAALLALEDTSFKQALHLVFKLLWPIASSYLNHLAFDSPLAAALFSSSATKIAAVEFQHSHLKYLLIEISADASTAASAIRAVRPDFLKLKAAGSDDIVGIIITVCDGSSKIFCRFFAPFVGINEDPATGSAFSVLLPYWHKRLQKQSFEAEQCSARGGHLRAELVRGSSANDSIRLTASSVVVIRGQLYLQGLLRCSE